jgi:hypothetical protein
VGRQAFLRLSIIQPLSKLVSKKISPLTLFHPFHEAIAYLFIGHYSFSYVNILLPYWHQIEYYSDFLAKLKLVYRDRLLDNATDSVDINVGIH